MAYKVEAVYENGILKPLQPLELTEHQRVSVTIDESLAVESPEEALRAWEQVYEGLSDEEIVEIEALILDRSHFMPLER